MGALITVYVVYNLARWRTGSNYCLAIVRRSGGPLCHQLFPIMYLSTSLHEVVFWIMGSLSNKGWRRCMGTRNHNWFCFHISVCARLKRDAAWRRKAKHLGEVETVKKILIVAGSLVVASAVSISGIIGFVGLIIPHIVRLIVGPDHRTLLPASALIGSIFIIICDTIARTIIAPMEIPVGIVTSLFGGPFFVYLLRKGKKQTFL